MVRFKLTIDRFKQSEYTGKNRCPPCTIVNVVIAVIASVVVAGVLVGVGVSVYALPAAAVTIVVSLVAIYFRGYLVPGTPRLTKQYFPRRLLRWFGKVPSVVENRRANERSEDSDTDFDDETVEAVLIRADVVEECRDGTDLCLTDQFRSAWHDQIATVREGDTERERLLAVLDVEEEVEIEFEDHGTAFEAEANGYHVGTWESQAAFIADVAAGELLSDRLAVWDDCSSFERGELLQSLRLFLETCPACGDPLSFSTDTVESCCTSHEVAAVTCDECEQRVFEAPVWDDDSPTQPL
jgi:hypothetical protein